MEPVRGVATELQTGSRLLQERVQRNSEVSKYAGRVIQLTRVNGLIISLLKPGKPLLQHPLLAMLI